MKHLFLAAALAPFIAGVALAGGTDSKLTRYQAAVADSLPDPATAQFRRLRIVQNAQGQEALCGEVNTRNGPGEYTGFQPFYSVMVSQGASTVAVLWSIEKVGLGTIRGKCR
jgi:hypothetical protein